MLICMACRCFCVQIEMLLYRYSMLMTLWCTIRLITGINPNHICLYYRGVKDDSVVRVQMLSFLAALDTKNQDHVHFVEYLISHMMKKQWELVQTKTYSNFPNSLLHRKKHRLFSGLLVLLKFIIQVS